MQELDLLWRIEDVIDTSNLYTQIMLNRDSINLNEQGIIDSASAIRTALNAHISADNDVSSTNELNSSFGVVGTNLRLTDAGGNLDVPLTDIIDTSGLSNRIDENEQAIIDTASAIRTTLNSHINADEDTDSTNEYNTGFELNGTGDSLVVTDAGTRFAVAIEDVIDTSNLYAQILLNRDSINLNEQGIIDSTAAVRTALVDTASAIRTALNDHITNDEDTDSTNEYNTGFEVNGTGDSLIISDAGTRFAVAIEDVIDTSNLYAQILLNRDSINLNEQGIIDSTSAVRTALVDTASAIRTALNDHITNDEDTDSTNEYNTGFEVNGTGDSLIITDAGTRFAVAIEDVIDTSNLYAQILLNRDSINLNEQGIIDSTSAVRTALVDTASAIRTALNDHITNDEDTDSTNEYNTGFEVNGTGDSLIISDAGTRFAVAIEDVIDTSNLYAQILLNRDSINFNEQGIIDSTAAVRSALVDTASDIRGALIDTASNIRTSLNQHINEDEDKDSTNELIKSVSFDTLSNGLQADTLKIQEADTTYAVRIETWIKAAGKVSSTGAPIKVYGATVSQINQGDYQITFTQARPDANYIIQLSLPSLNSGNDDPGITYYDQQTSGFKVNIGDNDNGGTASADVNSQFMFTVIDFDF
jgi:LEA14-like dessication related protein